MIVWKIIVHLYKHKQTMTTLTQLAENKNNSFTTELLEMEEKLAAKKKEQEAYNAKVTKFNMAGLEAKLASLKMSVQRGSFVVNKNDEVYLDLVLLVDPKSKYKEIRHNGYDRSGRGKNHNRLTDRAKKLDTELMEAMGENYVARTNEFCFNIDTFEKVSETGFTVLVDIWMK